MKLTSGGLAGHLQSLERQPPEAQKVTWGSPVHLWAGEGPLKTEVPGAEIPDNSFKY